MGNSLSRMQGVSGHIETHYEAMSYYSQEKKVCYHCKNKLCNNEKSNNNNHLCIGYTKCSDFISEESYNRKILKKMKAEKRKSNHTSPEAICYTKVTNKRCDKKMIYKKNK